MPPFRTANREAPLLQTPTPAIIVAHFLRQIEANHISTPSQGHPIPLHFETVTRSLSEWAWPCDTETEERVQPSELESFRRTHRFKTPSCLCALLEGHNKYTESRIGIVETVTNDEERNRSTLNGEYVATCARQRCGYFLCLERFYPLFNLKLQVCYKRAKPLEPQELATIRDIDKSLRAGDGLFQLMTDIVIRGSARRLEKLNPDQAQKTKDALMNELAGGMSEDRFWATFVQCLLCKSVTLRKRFALGHDCRGKGRRGRPYSRSLLETPSPPAIGSSVARRLTNLGIPSSPTPTEVADHDVGTFDVFADAEDADETEDDDSGSDAGLSLVSDDSFVLPTVAEIFASMPARARVTDSA